MISVSETFPKSKPHFVGCPHLTEKLYLDSSESQRLPIQQDLVS